MSCRLSQFSGTPNEHKWNETKRKLSPATYLSDEVVSQIRISCRLGATAAAGATRRGVQLQQQLQACAVDEHTELLVPALDA